MLRASLSFRLTLIYIALFVGSVALLAGVAWWSAVRMPLKKAESGVQREADALADIYILDGREALVRRLIARARAPSQRRAFHAFIASDGTRVTSNLPSWPGTPTNGWLRLEADTYAAGDEDDYEALTLDRHFDDGARLLVGRDIESIDESEETLRAAAAWVIAMAIVLGLGGGALMSRAIGRRLDTITQAARVVIDGNLSGRVPIHGSGDDFDRLSAVLNQMLTRIEGLMESVRRVSDNVAHELRTPLARLRVTLEDLANGQSSERAALVGDAVEEAARLEAVFDAVLRIARIESGRHGARREPVNVSTVFTDAAELYAPNAEEREHALTTDIAPDLWTEGDRDLLFQGICNLLDNAIKYTPPGGQIALRAQRDAALLRIVVRDTGPGMAANQRVRATERFYRAAETATAPGAGLGLSLVAAVAELHGSTLRLDQGHPGLMVVWTLPAADHHELAR